MKTAEEWSDCFNAMPDDLDKPEMVGFIRSIQDDARGDGMSIVLDRIRNSDVTQELLKASAQMRIADRDSTEATQFDRQHARDNATEHRRIAEAYLLLAQAMKT